MASLQTRVVNILKSPATEWPVIAGEAKYEPPEDQIVVHKVLDAIYKSAEEGKEIRL